MQCQNTRSGFSLLELVSMMAISSLFMVMAVTWIGESMKFSARIQSHQRQHAQLTQLSRSFRNDVKMSESMKLENNQLVLSQRDGKEITYLVTENEIVVTNESPSSIIRRERFPLESESEVSWITDEMPHTIGLVVTRKPFGGTNPSNMDSASNTDSDHTLPIDIHIIASVKRWPVEYVHDLPQRGDE